MTAPAFSVSKILFISDLHLSPKTPEILEQFRCFLEQTAPLAQSVYILGDLFDAWIGDDDPSPFAARVRQMLHNASRRTSLFFQHGNRDFLLGETFCRAAGLELLPEEHVVQIGGKPILLLHGDQLCTDDKDYQQARKLFRSPQFKAQALALSIPERIRKAEEIRQLSGEATAEKPADIMDVNQQAVEDMMRKHGVLRLVHGHTHRPASHQFQLAGQAAERIVLSDWRADGSTVLHMDEQTGTAKLETF